MAMKTSTRNCHRLFVALGVSSILLLLIHQISYVGNGPFTSSLQGLLEIVDACPQTSSESNHDTQQATPSNISNIIHQIWKNADVHTYSIEASRDSWKTLFEPLDYTVKLWTEDDVVELIKTKYSWFLSTYESYTQNIQRADVARLVVVHAEGGIYADLDVYPTSAQMIQCIQSRGLQALFASTEGTLGLSNHFFMAEKGSRFIEWALQEAKRRGGEKARRILLPYLQVFWSTGPIMITTTFQEYAWMYTTESHQVGVLDPGFRRNAIRHKAGRSWHGMDGQILNWLADHFSEIFPWFVGALSSITLWSIYLVIRRWRRI